MRRVCRGASFFVLMVVAGSPAAVLADPQVHMAWDDCGAAGSVTKIFACNTNVGAEQLYVSFVPPAGITLFNALEVDIRLWVNGTSFPPVLPLYWSMGAGQCRPQSLTLAFFTSGPFTCANPWPASAAGGTIVDSSSATNFQTRIRALAAVTPGDEQSLDPGTEYYGFHLVLSHKKSTGLGACDGCSTPIGMELRSLKIYQNPSGLPPYEYETGYRTGVFQTVNWQCPGDPLFRTEAGHGGELYWFVVGWDFPGCATPTQQRSWGSIKSLYR